MQCGSLKLPSVILFLLTGGPQTVNLLYQCSIYPSLLIPETHYESYRHNLLEEPWGGLVPKLVDKPHLTYPLNYSVTGLSDNRTAFVGHNISQIVRSVFCLPTQAATKYDFIHVKT